MVTRKETDEVGQRKTKVFKRDALGRFAKKIEPLPIEMKINSTKWATEECNCDCCKSENTTKPICSCKQIRPGFGVYELKKLQLALNPKKDCKNAYEEAHRHLISSGGMISKVLRSNSKRPFGFLVRIPSMTNPDIVFISFMKTDPRVNNTYFQKLTAIVSTIIKGEKFLKKRIETGDYIDEIPFDYYINSTCNLQKLDGRGMNHILFDKDIKYIVGKKLNYFEYESFEIDDEVINYFHRFEEKARDYYKENGKNKKIIVLPFTLG
jgi:hypothetical protein